MSSAAINELYQQVILDHNKNPRNYRKLATATHQAEGFNPLCGDELKLYIVLDETEQITDISFEGTGCTISKASASMMTAFLKGKNKQDAEALFEQFHKLLTRELMPDKDKNDLGKLTVFSGVWQYPARVKCASLCWHTLKNALNNITTATTE